MKLVTTTLIGMLAFASIASAEKKEKKDIVDTAVAAGSFNTLAAALKAGGLVDALKGTVLSLSLPQPTKLSQSCQKARWKHS